MSEQPTAAAATEAALITRTGLGDEHAFATLVARHREAVDLLASLLDPHRRHPGLVAEVFEIAHGTLRLMLGPTEALRPYLLLLTRRLLEAHPDGTPTHPLAVEHFSSSVPFREPAAAQGDVVVEFSRLPEAWQLLLWHLEVEGDSPVAAAALIGVSPVAVPALVTSARATLRRALLARHRARALPPVCLAHTLRLSRSTRISIPRVAARHAAECSGCATLVAGLDTVERDLAAVLAAHLLGPVAEHYLVVRRTASRSPAVRL